MNNKKENVVIKKAVIELEYEIIKKFQTEFQKDSYGISIVKRENKNVEQTIVEDITTKENFINSILSTLKRNLVMPISLKEIIYDIIP